MRKILSLSLVFLFAAVPSTMAAEIWSDVIYTEQTSTTTNWSEPSKTEIWSEAETSEQWTDTGSTQKWQYKHFSFTVDPVIEDGVIYAPVEEVAGYLGLAILPLEDPNGIAVIKGDREILYFFQGQSRYVQFDIKTEEMEIFSLPRAVQQQGELTIVPIDIIIQFADGSMNYNSQSKKVTINDMYEFSVTAKSPAAYTKQWTEPKYTEQWAETPNSSIWSENIEIPGTGGILVFQTNPVNENGRFLVPLRELFEMLGVSVEWDAKTSTISAVKESRAIKLTIGSQQAYVNGQVKPLDAPGKIIKGKTMVPLRFISEALGEKVNYDAEKMEITVGKDRILLPSPNTQTISTSASKSNVPYGGMTDQQWETQKILDRYFNDSFNMTGTYRPSYQWNSGY